MSSSKKKGHLFIGTSGWQYKHWKELFYPKDIKTREWMSYYSGQFKAVELNSSFYHQPSKKVFSGWGEKAPHGFIFAVKAPRFFTHLKRLTVSDTELTSFIDAATALGSHLGPILFQLPPRWHLNYERMYAFTAMLPKELKFAVEFRDTSWYTSELYDLLRKTNIAFCIYELGGHKSPVISTASFVYIRLHGPGQKYRGSYSLPVLRHWAVHIRAWIAEGKDVYVFFDNDESAYAPGNAKTLIELLADL